MLYLVPDVMLVMFRAATATATDAPIDHKLVSILLYLLTIRFTYMVIRAGYKEHMFYYLRDSITWCRCSNGRILEFRERMQSKPSIDASEDPRV